MPRFNLIVLCVALFSVISTPIRAQNSSDTSRPVFCSALAASQALDAASKQRYIFNCMSSVAARRPVFADVTQCFRSADNQQMIDRESRSRYLHNCLPPTPAMRRIKQMWCLPFDQPSEMDSTCKAMAAYKDPIAVTYPYAFFQEQNIDRHQVGSVRVNIDSDGKGRLVQFWSNGDRVWGHTFYASVVFVTKDGTVIWSNKQTKAINPSLGGHAKEASVVENFTLDDTQLDAFDHVLFKMGKSNCEGDWHVRCCDQGLEIGSSSRTCTVPDVPGTRK